MRFEPMRVLTRWMWAVGLAGGFVVLATSRTVLADELLDEAVSFTGQILFVEYKVPALVIGAVRNGETSVHGFGERSDGAPAPDGDTLLRIGSITKAFTGQVLANLVAEGKVSFADTLGNVEHTAPVTFTRRASSYDGWHHMPATRTDEGLVVVHGRTTVSIVTSTVGSPSN